MKGAAVSNREQRVLRIEEIDVHRCELTVGLSPNDYLDPCMLLRKYVESFGINIAVDNDYFFLCFLYKINNEAKRVVQLALEK